MRRNALRLLTPYASLSLGGQRDRVRIKFATRTSRAAFIWRLSVDLAPIADLDYEDAERTILNVADDSIVNDTVAPVRAEYWSGQYLACVARAFLGGNAFIHEIEDALRCCLSNLRSCLLADSV